MHIKMPSRITAQLMLVLVAVIANVYSRPHHANISPYVPLAHPAVLENEALESLYPSYLKNPFYKTPRVRAALEKFSWLSYGEQPVKNRIADAVPRKEIYKLLAHAGFIGRDEYAYA